MSNRTRSWMVPAIALLALASSATGIVNGFTYDDVYIIQRNPFVHTLHAWWNVLASPYWPREWGGDGYRPLTILSFRLEWALGHGSPMVFHAVNILLYVASAVLAFALARRLLPLWAAWVAAALFAVDPVHVEAVANLVGQSELLVAVAVLAATVLYLDERRAGAFRLRIAAGVVGLYVAACLSKEHGIVLPAILLSAELLFVRDTAPMKERVKRLRPFYLLLAAVALAFMAARSHVLSSGLGLGGFAPYTAFSSLHISTPDRILTAFSVVPQWIRLLLWPAHLSAEYGPAGIPIAQGFDIWQVPGMVLLVAVVALGVVLARRQAVISFGIAVVCIALLPSSNLILPAGIMLAERTLFLPSVGAMLVVGGGIVWLADVLAARRFRAWVPAMAGGLAGALIVAAGVRSATRSTVWHDNGRLFAQTVRDEPLVYRGHFMYANYLFGQKRRREGEAEYHTALTLFPYDPSLSYAMAAQYYEAHNCPAALPLLRWTLGLDPEFPTGRTELAVCLLNEGHPAEARVVALQATRFGRALPLLRSIIAAADSAQAADTTGKNSVPQAVTLAGHTGRSPETMQNAARRTASSAGPSR